MHISMYFFFKSRLYFCGLLSNVILPPEVGSSSSTHSTHSFKVQLTRSLHPKTGGRGDLPTVATKNDFEYLVSQLLSYPQNLMFAERFIVF